MAVQAPLNSVAAIIADVRTLLLDQVQPYRYADVELLTALNTALLEARRLRADLFVTRYGNAVPYYGAVSGEPFCVEAQFRLGFVFGTAAQALLRDDEDVQDSRANTFMGHFREILTGVKPLRMPPNAGTPSGPAPSGG